MSKIFYVVAFLAVCQYAAAASTAGGKDSPSEAAARAVGIIQEVFPSIKPTVDRISNVLDSLPPAEKLDDLGTAAQESFTTFVDLAQQLQQLIGYVSEHLPDLAKGLGAELQATIANYIKKVANSDVGQEIRTRVFNIVSDLSSAVAQGINIFNDVQEICAKVAAGFV